MPLQTTLLASRLFACLAIACSLGAVVTLPAAEIRRDPRPNLLFILLDDLGKEWISAYGAEDIRTPHLDALAAGGTRFENFYVMPQCTPTRLTFLTGQYPFRHGWVNHWDVPRWGGRAHYDWKRNPSIARVLRDAGYRTAVAGKWQINDFRVQPAAMSELGFEAYRMWTGGQGEDAASDERYWDPYIHTPEGSSTWRGKFGDDVFTEFLIEFLRTHRHEPMFLYYPMCLPHSPFTTTPAEPAVAGNLERHKAMVRYADQLIGRLIAALEELDLRRDTLVIISTDNGTAGNITGTRHGRRVKGGKSNTTEAGVCVPLIVNGPGRVAAGKVSPALLSIADFLPTFAELAGTQPQPGYTYDGRAAVGALLGREDRSPHSWILAMGGKNDARLTRDGVQNAWVYRDRVLRDERFKLHVDTRRQPTALYDLAEDPAEERNLIASQDAVVAAARARLSAPLAGFPERDRDPIYTPLPPQPWDVKITAESQVWKK